MFDRGMIFISQSVKIYPGVQAFSRGSGPLHTFPTILFNRIAEIGGSGVGPMVCRISGPFALTHAQARTYGGSWESSYVNGSSMESPR